MAELGHNELWGRCFDMGGQVGERKLDVGALVEIGEFEILEIASR